MGEVLRWHDRFVGSATDLGVEGRGRVFEDDAGETGCLHSDDGESGEALPPEAEDARAVDDSQLHDSCWERVCHSVSTASPLRLGVSTAGSANAGAHRQTILAGPVDD